MGAVFLASAALNHPLAKNLVAQQQALPTYQVDQRRAENGVVGKLDRFANTQSAFERLTSKVWGIEKESFIQFRQDGSYRWKKVDQIAPYLCPVGVDRFDREGLWKLQWKDDHGIVQLETGDLLSIAFRQGQLVLQGELIPAAKNVVPPKEDTPKEIRVMAPKKMPAIIEKLCQHSWRKSNRFDLFMYPTTVRFDMYGRYSAEFRDGECKAGGFWSLTGSEQNLTLTPDPNQCDQRGNSTASVGEHNSRPIFKHDMLIFFGVSYLPEGHDKTKQKFTFDRYQNSVRTTGWYSGDLQKNQPKKLTLHFENMSQYSKQLESLKVTLEEYSATRGKPENAAAKSTLLELELDVSLEHTGSEYSKTVEITPRVAGEVVLTFNLSYRDSQQEYHGYNNYFGTIDNTR